MPFKIVKTVEDGKEKLCVVPYQWETKGILKYPVKSSDYKLYRDGNSRASHEWPTMQCQVKRSAIFTYKQANEILNEMVRTSDTDHSVNNTKSNVYDASYKENTADSYNDFAEHLILNRQHDERINTAINDNSVEYEFITPTINNTVPIATASNMQQQQQYDNTKIFEVLQANQTILLNVLQVCNSFLENQALPAEKVDALSENLKKTTHKVIALSVQTDDGFTRLQKTVRESAAVIPLGISDPDERRFFEMKPVDSVGDLENLESMLSDDNMKKRLTKIYSILCTKSIGNGGTCAYKLLDALFTREFICKCSWSGGSRGKEIKVALKGYKNVLNFFFAMVHSWDEKFSVEDSERFFKIVLKNALKRKETKNIRSSSQRKPNLKKQSQVIQTEGKNFTKVIKDKKGTQNKDDAVSITEKYIVKSFAIKSFEQHSNKRQSFIESGENNDDIILNEQNKQMHEDETSMIEKLIMSEKEEGKNRTKINTKKRRQTTTESSYESDEEKEEQTNESIRKQSIIKRQKGNNKGETEETTKKNADNFIDLEEGKNEQRDKNIRKLKKVQIIKRQNSKGETSKRAKKQENDHRSNLESSNDTDEDENEPKYEHIIKHNKVIKIQRGNNKEKIGERAKKRDDDEKSNGETSSFDT
ncbi:uncharacterized protein LOC126375474 [Pectinophora gossypiella]|uniref:uncharacterized protein LOC126375474 n=1 Tax=Pectinophora gossypiella TaxID=13191 RepID=UPI00214EDD31|nr:uncharacterized protein LOC126375474 [Pectinophora gossypiella]